MQKKQNMFSQDSSPDVPREKWLGTKDVGKKLGYTQQGIRDLIKQGKLPGARQVTPRRYLIPESAIEAFLGRQQGNHLSVESSPPTVSVLSPEVLALALGKHFDDLSNVVRLWTKQIYYADSEEDIAIGFFPARFEPRDGSPGYHEKGSLAWRVTADGPIDVWFKMEKHLLFGALREHLTGTRIWQTYEELKSWLSKAIQRASETNKPVRVDDRVSPLKKQLMEDIETLLAQHTFPGKCSKCPS